MSPVFKNRSRFIGYAFLGLMLLANIQCGGSSTNAGGEDTPPDITLSDYEQTNATALIQTTLKGASSISEQNPNIPPAAVLAAAPPLVVSCPYSGSFEVNHPYTQITYTDCTFLYDNVTVVQNGTIAMTMTPGLIKATFTDFETTITVGTDTSRNFYMTGFISFEETPITVRIDITGEFNDADYHTDGVLTENPAGILNGYLNVVVHDDYSVVCTFVDFDATTATEADIQAACGF